MIAVLAALGALFAVRRPSARILAVMVLGYSIPYAIGVPYFDRYRYPIEPLLLLFASYALLEVIQLGAGMVGLQTAPAEVEAVRPLPALSR